MKRIYSNRPSIRFNKSDIDWMQNDIKSGHTNADRLTAHLEELRMFRNLNRSWQDIEDFFNLLMSRYPNMKTYFENLKLASSYFHTLIDYDPELEYALNHGSNELINWVQRFAKKRNLEDILPQVYIPNEK